MARVIYFQNFNGRTVQREEKGLTLEEARKRQQYYESDVTVKIAFIDERRF